MTRLLIPALALAATPAVAATKNPFSPAFYSLANTDFIVLISFLLFVGILIYFKVPGMITKQLDQRAENIRAELDEAKQLREEAQTLLASYERKQREVQDQADRIVKQARETAEQHAEEAKENLRDQIERRVKAAEDQIASAEASAIKRVRDEAARIAVAAAADVIRSDLSDDRQREIIDGSIQTVEQKLH